MSTCDGYSPGWQKPSEIMKLLRRRSSSNSRGTPSPSVIRSTGSSCYSAEQGNKIVGKIAIGGKRKNPFGRSPLKPKRLNVLEKTEVESLESCLLGSTVDGNIGCYDTSLEGEDRGKLFERLHKHDLKSVVAVVGPIPLTSHELPTSAKSSQSIKPSPLETNGSASESPGILSSVSCPVDWSLRSKVRYTSLQPFDWCSPLASIDEAMGMRDFVAGGSLATDDEQRLIKDPTGTFAKQRFQSLLMYWIHPNLPWLSLFPRYSVGATSKVGPSITGNWTNNSEDVLKMLYTDWSDSMTSAYQSLRTGLLDYMYVCCHNLTILLRAEDRQEVLPDNTAGSQPRRLSGSLRVGRRVYAVLTPTSKGFRDALKSEGIEFSLPLKEEERQSSGVQPISYSDKKLEPHLDNEAVANNCSKEFNNQTTSQETIDDEDDNDDAGGTNESASRWLEDLGLDKSKYKSVEPGKVQLQRDDFRRIDYRPESTVYVDGLHVNALFNYLLNCPSLFATAGPQAGIPPTILSPSPFRGATLQSLKVRQCGLVRLDSGFSSTHGKSTNSVTSISSYVMEVTGPILPRTVEGFVDLFKHSQHGEFTATCSVNESSAPLSAAAVVMSERQQVECRKNILTKDDQDRKASVHSTVPRTTSVFETHAVTDDMTNTLLKSDEEHLFNINKQHETLAIREIVCRAGQFTWTV